MSINISFSKSAFLQTHWQKKPLVVRNAFRFDTPFMTGGDLAGLACEEFIESRIISSNENQTQWTCEYGHFSEKHFQNLADKNWTLLVQNVDDFIEETKELTQAFDFLPAWRLDDVMFSYATPGGGVGPHFDYYDVFLLQTSGSREWIIGQNCNSETQLRDHEDMKLLENFIEKERYILEPGDMIYIPAGVAHWGTALSNDCITASIGFRAPAYSDLLAASVNSISDKFTPDHRYKDFEITEDKYLIPNSIKEQFSKIYDKLSKEELLEALSHQFSLQVTEIRHPDLIEIDSVAIQNLDVSTLRQQPNSRFAYRLNENSAILYVNGESYSTDNESAKAICHSDFSVVQDKEILIELLNSGALFNA